VNIPNSHLLIARMARVLASLAHLALEGHRGRAMLATIDQIGGQAYLVLRAGPGAAVAQMILRGLELVNIGEGRVLIVPDIEPLELTMDCVGILMLDDVEEFRDMVRRATHIGIWGGNLHLPRATSTSAAGAPALHRRRVDSPRRMPFIPEVSRAEGVGAECTESARASFPELAETSQEEQARELHFRRGRPRSS